MLYMKQVKHESLEHRLDLLPTVNWNVLVICCGSVSPLVQFDIFLCSGVWQYGIRKIPNCKKGKIKPHFIVHTYPVCPY